MDTKVNSRQNFGWFYGTHIKIVREVVEDIPRMRGYGPILEEAVKKPDFFERGFLSNRHFYSPINNKSYLDFNKKSNAFCCYKDHVENMLVAIKEKDTLQIMEHAGRALHFLQEMTQPQHSQKCFISNKINFWLTHVKFENFIKCQHDDFMSKKLKNINSFSCNSFDDLFLKTATQSQTTELPTKKNQSVWKQIGETGISQAIDATKKFFELLHKELELVKN